MYARLGTVIDLPSPFGAMESRLLKLLGCVMIQRTKKLLKKDLVMLVSLTTYPEEDACGSGSTAVWKHENSSEYNFHAWKIFLPCRK